LLLLVVSGSIADLAAATVLLLLIVFIAVNAALVVLKRRPGEAPGQFEVPLFLPIAGMAVCAALLLTRLSSLEWRAPALAGLILLASVGLFAALRSARPDPQ
jgi:amino acid transporter